MNHIHNRIHPVILLLIVICALVARLVDIDKRPMHGDESVNAYKLGELLDDHEFRYNPDEYHGPLLYYVSALFTSIQGKSAYSELTERDLRFVAVFFSVLLLLLWILFRRYMEYRIAIISVLLLGFSSPLLFFSRYYIHEMLFVFLIYASLFFIYDYLTQPGWGKIILSGLSIGLMIATKETWIIILPILGASAIFLYFSFSESTASFLQLDSKTKISHCIAWILVLFGVFCTLYSAGFSDKEGLLNAFRAIPKYINRGTESGIHVHPWYEYLRWLFFFRGSGGYFWSEGFLALSSILGYFFLLKLKAVNSTDNAFLSFIGFFSFLLLIAFSLVPYKTPWNLLVFYPGLLTIAAFGMIQAANHAQKKLFRIPLITILFFGNIHVLWQSVNLNYIYHDHPGNPYVYAHPTSNLLQIPEKMRSIAEQLPERFDTPVQVIIPGDDYWPLPWYLREFKSIGWWSGIPESDQPAPFIISSNDLDADIVRFIYERPPPGQRHLYIPLFKKDIEMRPGKFLNAYVRFDLLPAEISL